MKKCFTIISFALLLALSLKGQVNDQEIRQQVLDKGIVDSLFVFGKWTANGQTETQLKYLGQVITTDGRVYKIMNSVCLWGLSQRATSRILIFNDKNQYLGNYYVGNISDLPDKIENEKLNFSNIDNDDCDKKLFTKVDFSSGLPKQFFVKCKGEYGDMYSFSSE